MPSSVLIFSLLALACTPHMMSLLCYLAEKKGRNDRIYSLEPEPGQVSRELKNSIWMPLHALVAYYFYSMGVFADGSVRGFLVSLIVTYLWAEVFHYYSHKLFHLRAFLWIHREHHKSKVCTPFTALSFSFTEKLIFSVGIWSVPALLGTFLSMNYYGVWAWYMAYLVINSFSHSNFEVKSKDFITSRAGRYVTAPTYHALHHSRYIKNYGLGTRFLDKIHNTEWSDYPLVYSAVLAQRPLKKLHQKG